METRQTPPNFLNVIFLPDDRFNSLAEDIVDADYQIGRIGKHIELCLDPESFSSWAGQFYKRQPKKPKFRRSILLIGAAGVGKTTIAKICANNFAKKYSKPVCIVDLGPTRSKYVGESSKNLRIAFDYIRGLAESFTVILFIDEFDSVGVSRNVEQINEDVAAMVNTLNQQMSSLDSPNVFIIACSNLEGRIDYATKRRFDFVFTFRRPTLKQRMAIFETLLDPYGISKDTIYKIAAKTQNYTQDDIVRISNLAVELAFFQNKPVSYWNVWQAVREIKPTGEYT
ncbi:MAG: ATP-binding protein [Candidatus Nitrosotenuis sp.]